MGGNGNQKKKNIGGNVDFLKTKADPKKALHFLACVRLRPYSSLCRWLILSSD